MPKKEATGVWRVDALIDDRAVFIVDRAIFLYKLRGYDGDGSGDKEAVKK